MTLYLLILIITGVTTAALGSVVYLRNPKAAMSRYFLLLCLATISWTVANYLIDHANLLYISQLSAHIAPAAALNILFWLYMFTSNFKKRPSRTTIFQISLSLVWLLGTVFAASDLVIATVTPGSKVMNIQTGMGYLPYLVIILSLFGGALWQLIRFKQKANVLEKTQIRFMVWGIAISIGIAIFNNGILPIFISDWEAVKVTPILSLVFIGSISYAIIKHRLFDIRLVAARLLAYAMATFVLGLAYGVIVFKVVDDFLLHTQSQSSLLQRGVYTLMAVFMVFTFQPVKKFFDHVTDRIFFKDRYDSAAMITRISRLMAETVDIAALSNNVLEMVLNTIRIESGAMLIWNGDSYVILASNNMETIRKIDSQTMAKLMKATSAINAELGEKEALQSLLSKAKINIAIPFQGKDNTSGALLLGQKRSGDMYNSQDIQVLEAMGPELAIAIENARSYQQVRDFNTTLQHEIEKATEQLRSANEQLSRKNHQLQQLDKLKDEFISVTSHELRTPLTAIRGYLWMVMHNKKDDSAKLYMDRAYVSAERLIDLVNDTLDISRIESGRVLLNPESTKLPSLARLVVQELEPKATERHQHLTVKQATNLPTALCDADKVHQVLTNLIGNALKFTPEHGSITIHFYVDKQHIVTAITDTGPGISDSDQKRLFQKFSRLEATVGVPGTGLGLYLCQQIIELSKGKIWMDSQIGQGSTFFFSLPISKHQPSILPIHQHVFSRQK
jgi:signal transduction histidine kinase